MNGDPLDRLRLTPQSALDHHHKPGDPSIVSGLHVFYFRAFEEEPGCPSASPFSSLFLCKKSSSSWDANYLGPAKTVRITDITFQLGLLKRNLGKRIPPLSAVCRRVHVKPWPGDLRTPSLQVSFLNLQVPFSLTIFFTVSL
ncbi:unnamed protein product [Lactuca saligna]|uniref:Uncharacterized protein n=1 Tax=Lactuca saligna TaxID=75948 RepID=A0AA35YJP5_LACSI|nr:unnamed protein product [Lactuca saligna]